MYLSMFSSLRMCFFYHLFAGCFSSISVTVFQYRGSISIVVLKVFINNIDVMFYYD